MRWKYRPATSNGPERRSRQTRRFDPSPRIRRNDEGGHVVEADLSIASNFLRLNVVSNVINKVLAIGTSSKESGKRPICDRDVPGRDGDQGSRPPFPFRELGNDGVRHLGGELQARDDSLRLIEFRGIERLVIDDPSNGELVYRLGEKNAGAPQDLDKFSRRRLE